ncbi:hypothetical protein [Phenylobacterium sp.]|uniref:hypothetical protein n=1 Tax=Phenylobacterium sp. TaxID=1871053 RepID=UPI003D29EDD0
MSDGPTRDEEILARLAERDLAAVERTHDKLMAAEDAAEIAELGRTYTRMARSLRQTLALKARLAREREAAAVKRPRPPEPELVHEGLRTVNADQRVQIERARDAVLLRFDVERPDWDELDEAMVYDILITLAEEDEDFLEAPVETLVAQVMELIAGLEDDAEPGDRPDEDRAPHDSA